MISRSVVVATLLTCVGFCAVPAYAQETESDPHAHHREMMNKAEKKQAQITRVDLRAAQLLDQSGIEVELVEDVIGQRIVVVDFVYTTCTTVCPVLSAVLMQVQGQLGDRLGSEVALVSISVDPQRDTPARLKDYATKMHAGDGWTWLTGEKSVVDEVLKDFGAYTPNFEDHPAMMLVGDASTGEWSRFLGFPGANHIVDKINELAAARTAQSAVRE